MSFDFAPIASVEANANFTSPATDKTDPKFVAHIATMNVGESLRLSVGTYKSARALKVAANKNAAKAGRKFEFAELDDGKVVIARVMSVDAAKSASANGTVETTEAAPEEATAGNGRRRN